MHRARTRQNAKSQVLIGMVSSSGGGARGGGHPALSFSLAVAATGGQVTVEIRKNLSKLIFVF